MKIRILYSLFAASLTAILFWNASGGPAAVQGADRTGSPLSAGTCTLCHSSGSYSPSLSVQLLDGETAVTAYEPGKSYTLSVAVTGADAADGYGFQAVLLSGENDANAGTFGEAPSGMQVTALDNRMYAEHSARSTGNTFLIEWTAPEDGVGAIRLYAAGNAVNGNGAQTGDQGVSLTDPIMLTEMGTSDVNDRLLHFEEFSIAPNPTRAGVTLSLNNSKPGLYTLTLFNAVGQNIHRQSLNLMQGQQTHWLDLSEQARGLYFLQISNGQQLLTKKILKQ